MSVDKTYECVLLFILYCLISDPFFFEPVLSASEFLNIRCRVHSVKPSCAYGLFVFFDCLCCVCISLPSPLWCWVSLKVSLGFLVAFLYGLVFF